MRKLSEMETIIKEMNEGFSVNEVEYRKGKGGKEYPYVSPDKIIGRLNKVFNHFWDWEFIDMKIIEEGIDNSAKRKYDESAPESYTSIIYTGKLTVHLLNDIAGTETTVDIVKVSSGGNNTGSGNYGDDIKSAESDAIKRAASKLGVGLHLYDKNSARSSSGGGGFNSGGFGGGSGKWK